MYIHLFLASGHCCKLSLEKAKALILALLYPTPLLNWPSVLMVLIVVQVGVCMLEVLCACGSMY